jgi:hypothetical protein
MFCLAFILATAWNAELACDAAESVIVRPRGVGRRFGSTT